MARKLEFVCIAFGLAACLIYAVVVILRFIYPYTLWLFEGDIFLHVLRLKQGLDIYPEKIGIDFIPLIYMPVYYYIGVVTTSLIPGLPGLRIISILSILQIFIVIFKILKEAKVPFWLCIVVLGYLACTSHIAYGQMENVRNDGLMLATVLWGIYLVSSKQTDRKRVIYGSGLIAISFYIKQTGIIYALGIFLFMCIRKRRYIWIFILTYLIIFILTGVIIYSLHGPGWIFYTVIVPSLQKIYFNELSVDGYTIWLRYFPIIVLLGIVSIYYCIKNEKGNTIELLIWSLPASFLAYALPRCKSGGFVNNTVHLAVVLMVLSGWVFAKMNDEFVLSKSIKISKVKPLLLYLLVIIQFAILIYNPMDEIPNYGNYKINRDYIKKLAALKGKVFNPLSQYHNYLAGKETFFSYVPYADLKYAGVIPGYPLGMVNAFESGEISYLLTPPEHSPTGPNIPIGLKVEFVNEGMLLDQAIYKPNINIMLPPLKLYKVVPKESEPE
jgi:hypothetical protein